MYAEAADLDRDELTKLLRRKWHIDVATIRYEAVGFGTHHYFVTSKDRARWWVNVDDLTGRSFDELHRSLATATALRNRGFRFISAALESVDGAVLQPLSEHFGLSVYAFIEGRSYEGGPIPPADRPDLLRALGALHAAPIPSDPPTLDTLAVRDRTDLFAAIDDASSRWDAGPFAEQTRELIAANADALRARFERYDEIARQVASTTDRWVITHGEPHAANVIRTSTELVVIDWDTIGIAPPERDLWQIGAAGDADWRAYHAAGGITEIDRTALELFRLQWDLAEVAAYTKLFRQPHIGDANTRVAWKELQEYLADA